MADLNVTPGTILQQGDLDIHFQDDGGAPTNVFEITYDIYFVDPGPPEAEVLIDPSPRTPKNPSVGSYYANLMVPPGANIGTYRIRWSFREAAGQPVQEVVMEFGVIAPNTTVLTTSGTVQDCIDKLRILLRDQCVGGEEIVLLDVAGERMVVRMDELWEVLHGDTTS